MRESNLQQPPFNGGQSLMRDALPYPIAVSDRISLIYLAHQTIERDGHALVAVQRGERVCLPVGNTAAIMLGPGTAVTHAAVALCSLEGTTLLWVGEHGVRLYSAGNPRGEAQALLRQARCFSSDACRLRIARRIFQLMFDEPPPLRRSITQLRGLEGARVKEIFRTLADQYGIEWSGRSTGGVEGPSAAPTSPLNHAISTATAALYGLTEAVVLSLGYSPVIGFVHSGSSRSFVYDVADTIKFRTVVPLAFAQVAMSSENVEARVRRACRDHFIAEKTAQVLVNNLEEIFRADGPD